MAGTSRREAIRALALGSGSLILSPLSCLSVEKSLQKKLGIALVGLGYYSTDLLGPALLMTKNCYLAGIVTGTPAKAERWQKQYKIPDKNIYNYSNFDQIANNDSIDVIYIVLPPSMHMEYVVRAAKAGKHVWCEKPMAMTVRECQAMIDACKDNKRSLAIGYRLQHEPHTKEFRRIVQNGLLGKVKSLQCSAGYRESRTDHWKQKKEMGGGVLGDMGVYAIQGARLGTNMEPLSVVSAKFSTNRPDVYRNGLPEIAEARLSFPGGVIADIKTSFADNINSLDINFEKGNLRMSPYQAYAGLHGSSPLGEIHYSYEAPWQQANQMDEDAKSIIENRKMAVPGEEGLKDIRVLEAIYASVEQQKEIKVFS
jgi:glucose-fructose oxidoreductase